MSYFSIRMLSTSDSPPCPEFCLMNCSFLLWSFVFAHKKEHLHLNFQIYRSGSSLTSWKYLRVDLNVIQKSSSKGHITDKQTHS